MPTPKAIELLDSLLPDLPDYLPDGNYNSYQLKPLFTNNDFSSEKDFVNFILSNIEEFTFECFGYEYQSHKCEVHLAGLSGSRKSRGDKRIDILIKTKCNKTLALEAKYPRSGAELHDGIGQVLSQISLAQLTEFKIDEFHIVSTKIDSLLPLIIEQFNLPIGFIIMDKSKISKYINGSAKRK